MVYKCGSRSDPANYKPDSLLPVFSEIFEKAMQSKLPSFLDAKEFSHDFQFGFRANYSTEHACAAFLNFIHSAIDFGHIPAALFLDVRKAVDFFDSSDPSLETIAYWHTIKRFFLV